MRYLVEVPEGKDLWALDTVVSNEAKEFSQEHLDEVISSHRVVTKEEALEIYRKDNNITSWTDDMIIQSSFTLLDETKKEGNI
jgi:hypothetical protein